MHIPLGKGAVVSQETLFNHHTLGVSPCVESGIPSDSFSRTSTQNTAGFANGIQQGNWYRKIPYEWPPEMRRTPFSDAWLALLKEHFTWSYLTYLRTHFKKGFKINGSFDEEWDWWTTLMSLIFMKYQKTQSSETQKNVLAFHVPGRVFLQAK